MSASKAVHYLKSGSVHITGESLLSSDRHHQSFIGVDLRDGGRERNESLRSVFDVNVTVRLSYGVSAPWREKTLHRLLCLSGSGGPRR